MKQTIGYVVHKAGFIWTNGNLYYPGTKQKKVRKWRSFWTYYYEPVLNCIGHVGHRLDPQATKFLSQSSPGTEKKFFIYDEPLAHRLETYLKESGFDLEYEVILHTRT